jgi:hypothetical protein
MKKIFYGLLCSLLTASLFLPQVLLAGSVLQISAEPGVSIWPNKEYIGKTTKEENGLVIKDLVPGEYNLRATMGVKPVTMAWMMKVNRPPILKAW